MLELATTGGNTSGVDTGLELRYLNRVGSRVWSVEIEARDLTGANAGGWILAVGQQPYAGTLVGFAVNLGGSSIFFRYHINRILGDFSRFVDTVIPRDGSYHSFSISSDGEDLQLSIDGQLVGTLEDESFPASFIQLAVTAPTAEVWVDSVTFTSIPDCPGL